METGPQLKTGTLSSKQTIVYIHYCARHWGSTNKPNTVLILQELIIWWRIWTRKAVITILLCSSSMADGPSIPSWVQLLRLMTPHTHLEGMKRFTAYVTEVSEESRAGLSSRYEIAWQGKKTAIGMRPEWGFPHMDGACWLESPASAKREHPGFLIRLFTCGHKLRGNSEG